LKSEESSIVSYVQSLLSYVQIIISHDAQVVHKKMDLYIRKLIALKEVRRYLASRDVPVERLHIEVIRSKVALHRGVGVKFG
jgi:hypothetical protein